MNDATIQYMLTNFASVEITLSLVTVGQLPWDDIKILEPRAGHLISKF